MFGFFGEFCGALLVGWKLSSSFLVPRWGRGRSTLGHGARLCLFTINRRYIMAKSKGMTGKAASRIQSAGSKRGGGKVSKGSFASRAQRAAAKNGS